MASQCPRCSEVVDVKPNPLRSGPPAWIFLTVMYGWVAILASVVAMTAFNMFVTAPLWFFMLAPWVAFTHKKLSEFPKCPNCQRDLSDVVQSTG